VGGERPDGWTELSDPEPEQATPADELEIAAAAADPSIIPGKNYPLVIRAGAVDAPVLVAVDDQGELTYGEGYEPDEAARIFWEAMATQMPEGFKIKE
jgi:hypothetical protein